MQDLGHGDQLDGAERHLSLQPAPKVHVPDFETARQFGMAHATPTKFCPNFSSEVLVSRFDVRTAHGHTLSLRVRAPQVSLGHAIVSLSVGKVRSTTMSTSLQEKISDEVRAWLARRRLSASKAAAALHWNEMYMSRRLNNKTAFDLNDLEALAHLLEIPVTVFFENVDKDIPAFTGSQLVNSAGQRSSDRDITNASWFDSPSNRCATPPDHGNLIRPRQNPIVAA